MQVSLLLEGAVLSRNRQRCFMRRSAFFVSDGTGITAETLGNSLLTQFEGIPFKRVTIPYIDTPEKAATAVARINQATLDDGAPAIVFDTIVNTDIRDTISTSTGFMVDVFA